MDRTVICLVKWSTVKVADLGRVVTGKTPKTKIATNYGGEIPFLTPSDDMSVKYVKTTSKTLTAQGLQEVKNCLLPPDVVCVSCIGSDLGKVVITTEPTVTNQQINSIIVNKDKYDVSFVYYAMLTLGKKLNFISKTSTAVPIVNKSAFSSYEINCPDIGEQHKIAAVLSTLDAKIENNKRINDNLQAQAFAIFKAWFVDYIPFGRTKPPSWEKVTLDSITSLVSRGITPQYTDDSEQTVINQKCIRNHMVDLSEARKHIPKSISEKWLRFGDLLINSTGAGTLGRTAQVWFEPENLTVDSHVTIVRPAADYLAYYIGFWGLRHEVEIEALHIGSTGQTELPRDRVKAITLQLPDRDTLLQFNKMVRPMTSAIVSNQAENVMIAALRDTLLPKLMSGDIDVSEMQSISNK